MDDVLDDDEGRLHCSEHGYAPLNEPFCQPCLDEMAAEEAASFPSTGAYYNSLPYVVAPWTQRPEFSLLQPGDIVFN